MLREFVQDVDQYRLRQSLKESNCPKICFCCWTDIHALCARGGDSSKGADEFSKVYTMCAGVSATLFRH